MKRRTPGVWALVALALLIGACAPSGASSSSSKGDPATERAAERRVRAPKVHVDAGPGGTAEEAPAAPAGGSGELPEEVPASGLEPSPADLPFDSKVPVETTLTPRCVEPGGTVTLEVLTKPEAAVAYSAVYAGNKSGAEPPFGHGYGGNEKGYASKKGRYVSTWIVRLDAPRGPAKLDVVVGYRGKFGYDDPHFAVADANGACPKAWLASEDEAG